MLCARFLHPHPEQGPFGRIGATPASAARRPLQWPYRSVTGGKGVATPRWALTRPGHHRTLQYCSSATSLLSASGNLALSGMESRYS